LCGWSAPSGVHTTVRLTGDLQCTQGFTVDGTGTALTLDLGGHTYEVLGASPFSSKDNGHTDISNGWIRSDGHAAWIGQPPGWGTLNFDGVVMVNSGFWFQYGNVTIQESSFVNSPVSFQHASTTVNGSSFSGSRITNTWSDLTLFGTDVSGVVDDIAIQHYDGRVDVHSGSSIHSNKVGIHVRQGVAEVHPGASMLNNRTDCTTEPGWAAYTYGC